MSPIPMRALAGLLIAVSVGGAYYAGATRTPAKDYSTMPMIGVDWIDPAKLHGTFRVRPEFAAACTLPDACCLQGNKVTPGECKK